MCPKAWIFSELDFTPLKVGTPQEGVGSETISISTAFHPGANLDQNAPDLILISADKVFFHVHRQALQNATTNHFNYILLVPPTMWRDQGFSYILDDNADVLNVLLHTAYNLSIAAYSPTLDVLTRTIDALHKYGMPFDRFLCPNTPLFAHILSQAPLSPMQVYIAAARHRIEALAVPVSAYLLSYPLSDITDDMCEGMGAVYLRRLVMLHVHRNEELRKFLLTPPAGHPATIECGFVGQRGLMREWALETAPLSWQVRPDFSASLLQATLDAIHARLTCDQCKQSLNTRIRQLISQWSLTKRTI